MSDIPYSNALIIGAGSGISASLTRLLRSAGLPVAIAARDTNKLESLVNETGAIALRVDAGDHAQVKTLFEQADAQIGSPEVVIYNASSRPRGPLTELDPEEVEEAIRVSALGAFYATQEAAKRMVPRGKGAILITGATAGVKGFANSAPFAMGNFARRGLSQSAARELGPLGIHVAHVILDGSVRGRPKLATNDAPDALLDPDAIARTYIDLLKQHRSAWSQEIDLRPWAEKF